MNDHPKVGREVRQPWPAPFSPMSAGWATIVIPNYNHALYLSDAIESGLAQTYDHVEIIVVDDGSTDHSRQVVERYSGLISAIFQANQGLPAARNSGILAAKGEFICVLDADDMLEPTYLSTLISRLQQNPAAAAVTCGYQFVNQENKPLPQREARTVSPDRLFDVLLAGNFLVPESILVRRLSYEAAGPFDPALRACEDLDMWLRIASQEPIIYESAILTRHRVLAGSMSTNPERMHSNRLKVFEKHLGSLENHPPLKPVAVHYSRAYFTSVVEYLQVGDVDTAFAQLRQALTLNPALLEDPAIFYEMILGDQPKGWRGDFSSAHPQRGYTTAANMLSRLFAPADLPSTDLACQKEAFAQLALAAGLIAYGQSDFSTALSFFRRAIMQQPAFLLKKPLLTRLIKILFGLKRLQRLFGGPAASQP